MKAWLVLPIAAMLLVSAIPSYEIFADKPENPGRSNEKTLPPVEELTGPKSITLPDGTIADRVVHIFYEKDFAKPDKPGGNKGNGGGKDKSPPQESDCYSFRGANWKQAESYLVDTRNSGLTDFFVAEKIQASISDWETYGAHNIFGTGAISLVDGIDTSSTDGKNEIVFDTYEDGVIAVTITWISRVGPPSDRPIVEWDMLFNTKFSFGDAFADPTLMDFHGIAAHELGHAAGMGHTDTSSLCSGQTMFPTASIGEYNKRTLEIGDQTGIFKLYN